MEKEERTPVQEEEEEEEEEEYTTLVKTRKSRTEKGDVESMQNGVKNGICEENEHAYQSILISNGGIIFGNELNMKGLGDGVLGDEAECAQGQQNLVFLDKGVEINYGEKQMDESPPELGESEIVSQKLLIHTSESNSNIQGNRADYKYSISEIESTESDSIHEDELEETEADVERLLQKQTTHDLYCPNCNSCITRRVILRKRNRRVQLPDEDFKRNKTESAAVSKSGSCSAQAPDDELAEDDTVRETGSVLFRCLSCFSLFIPTGNGSKLFRIFGDKNGKETVGDEQVQLPSIKKKWFASNNQETTVERDSTKEQSEGYTKTALKEATLRKEIQVNCESGISGKNRQEKAQFTCEESAQDPVSSTQKGGLKLMVSSNDTPLALEKSEDKINNQRIQKETPGKDIVISIGTTSASEIGESITVSEETVGEQLTSQISVAVSETTEGHKNSAIELVKSIVYGGLAESITSLSVVSSAAGADITTLNIIALGLANLIGGFSVICHNLCKLRSDRIDQHSDQVSHQVTDQKDRYEELLGRRENFLLHAMVVILSYLISGSLPAVAYGFPFRVNDDKELKLLVVGATSFLCITVLAIGKAYVCRPPKTYVKTVMTYVVLGFTASGISYVAGVLIKRILEKLGLFQSSSVVNLILSEMAPKDSAWARY
ncbi:membrane protein of ER body-like protein isoform X2 [Henckelia pumila]|uniref:membrane protein of ER body-like protein isoform X2 n=1 Tax=Henckelia pumila TaxID=405737 RepID=UPI003C6E0F36